MKKTAILLAADDSRMMSKVPAGQHKVCGRAMEEYVVTVAKAAGCEVGQLHTVQEGLVYILCDAMPFLTADALEALGAAVESGADIAYAAAEGACCGMICCARAEMLDKVLAGGCEHAAETVLNSGLKAVEVKLCAESTLVVCDRVQLARAEKIMRARINEKLMLGGVTLIDPEHTYIEDTVVIGQDTVVYPNCTLQGDTVIGSDCVIYSNCRMNNAVVGDGTTVEASVLLDCRVGSGTTVGPNAYLRPKAVVGNKCRIGDFVEIKNANIGNGTKVSHLTYVGDADLGENINLGCGVVFSNYDGKKKYRSTIGDNAFIGCNVNIVSPVNVEKEAYIAAGSTITGDVPAGALAIARERQSNKAGWVEARKAEGKL